jgi:Rel/ankyrin family protein
MTELIITKLSHCSAPCNGGKEVILLCDRVTKDDIQVRFYQELNGQLVWEAFADLQPSDVHKQVAICFRTPRYFNEGITQPVSVQLQLRRPSDGCLSEARGFQLLPKEVDPDGLARKRQKIDEGCLERFLRENSIITGVSGVSGIGSTAIVATKREVIHVPRMATNIKVGFFASKVLFYFILIFHFI